MANVALVGGIAIVLHDDMVHQVLTLKMESRIKKAFELPNTAVGRSERKLEG